jgi:Fe2+ or Zn2+ uptake regulation protein
MSCEGETTELLRAGGIRLTGQRLLIITALRHADRHVTANDLHAAVAPGVEGQRISLSTVYRTLDGLAAAGLVTAIDLGDGATAYEWGGPTPGHHHLRCTSCGAEVETDLPELDEATRRIRRRTGFAVSIRHLGITGLCAVCAAASSTGGAASES